MRKVDYYFGRLNIIALIKDKKEFVLNGLRVGNVIRIRGFEWGFFEIDEIDSEIGKIIHGYLAKYPPVTKEEIAEPKTHKFIDQDIQNKVASKSRFFISLETNLIAYHPVNGITSRQFCDNFSKLFEQASGILVNLEIQTIREQFEFYEELKKMKVIKSIQIYLHPSNPHFGNWKKVHDKLVEKNADNYYEQYQTNDPDGLQNIVNDEDIIDKITMAEDGYGETIADGEDGQSFRRISTKENPLKIKAPSQNNEPENILSVLINGFNKILDRFK